MADKDEVEDSNDAAEYDEKVISVDFRLSFY
jgi:hypothetical protein